MKAHKIMLAALTFLAVTPAAAAAAVTGSVTGDAGAPVALAANGAATAIRNMDVQALSHVDDAADASVADVESQVAQRLLDRLSLRVEDPLLRAHEHRGLHESTTEGSAR